MSFIAKYLENKISKMTKEILDKNHYSLILNKPVYAVQANRSWEIVAVNNFGFVMMKDDISVSYTLVPGTEMIKIYEQIKSGEYKLKKRR